MAGCAPAALLAFSMRMSLGVALTTATLGIALPNSAQAYGFRASDYHYISPLVGLYYTGAGATLYGGASGAPWTVTNQGTVVNYGNGSAIELHSGTIVNGGFIGSQGDGISIVNGGLVTNSNGGTISGRLYGLHLSNASGGASTVVNQGIINATGPLGFAIYAGDGGTITNSSTGRITATAYGLRLFGNGVTVTNAGTIIASSQTGVYSERGGTIANSGTASYIKGGFAGILTNLGAATVTNAGRIVGTGGTSYGIYLGSGGLVTNDASGTISGTTDGVRMRHGAGTVDNSGRIAASSGPGVLFSDSSGTYSNTVINSGTIVGTGGTAVQFGAGNDLLELKPGAAFTGIVTGAGGSNTMELAVGGGTTGTVTGLGVSFTNFGQIKVDSGATWTITGANNTVATGVTLTNRGSLLNAGSVAVQGASGLRTTSAYLGNTGTIASTIGYGIAVYGPGPTAGMVVNAGTISANSSTGLGVYFTTGGGITNQAGGVIVAGRAGVGGAVDTLVNAGTIRGTVTGVYLGTHGTVTNQAGGTIVGTYGLVSRQSVVVDNSGSITGDAAAGVGIEFQAGGVVINRSGGVVTGDDGVLVAGAAGTIVNAGLIQAFGTRVTDAAVYLGNGGTVTNQSGGTITGAEGIAGLRVAETVINAGLISGTAANGFGISLHAGGVVTNQSGGTISGATGIFFAGGGSVDNAGVILGGGTHPAIQIAGGAGTVTNTGTISGYSGVVFSGAYNETLTNGGTIAGTGAGGVAIQFGGGNDRLILEPGAAFTGIVDGVGGTNTLELAGGTGTVAGLGVSFTNFGAVEVDSGASWQVEGANNTLASGVTLTNSGTLAVAGTLTNLGTIVQNWVFGVAAGGSLINSGSIAGALTLAGTGQITNNAGAIIDGLGDVGVSATGSASVANAGTIQGLLAGAIFADGGALTNASTGFIYGDIGVYGRAVTITNRGTIKGFDEGIELPQGGITNDATGTIAGALGIYVSGLAIGPVTVTNAGTIIGTGGTAIQFGTGDDRLILDPGSVITGLVNGAGGTNTLELAAGANGYINGLGVSFTNFGSVTVDSGAIWVVTGAHNTIASGVVLTNNGGFYNDGSLLNAGTITSPIALTNDGTLNNTGTIQTYRLVNSGSVINRGTILGFVAMVSGQITNAAGALISGGPAGIYALGDTLVTNAGTISGMVGVEMGALGSGGTLTNSGTASYIVGSVGVGFLDGAGTVINRGTIKSTGTVIGLGTAGVSFKGSGDDTVINSGTIVSADGNAIQFARGNDRLIVDPGAVFIGNVDGGTGTNTLELAGSGAGTVAGLGVSFTNFGQIHVDTGARWQLAGANTIGAGVTLANYGSVGNTGSLLNLGTIGNLGRMNNSGTLNNKGLVVGYYGLVSSGSIINSGTILSYVGITLTGSGRLTNLAGAHIYGYEGGVGAPNHSAHIVNAGTITGQIGVYLGRGGSVANTGKASYIVGYIGVGVIGAGTVINAGTIHSPGLYHGLGGAIAFRGNADDTVINSGTISGKGNASAIYFGGGDDRLIVKPGAVFVGTVDGRGGSNTLELAPGVGTDPLSGLGTEFLRFQNVVVDKAGSWKITGANNTIKAGVTLTNNGTLTNTLTLVNNGGLNNYGTLINTGLLKNAGDFTNAGSFSGSIALVGTGTIDNKAGANITGKITGDGTVTNAGRIAAGKDGTAIAFGAGDDRLILATTGSFSGKVDGGGGNNTLELAAGPGTGRLTGLSSLANFDSILVDSSARWTIAGTDNMIAAGTTLTNGGTLTVAGTLTNAGHLASTGETLTVTGLLNNSGSVAGTVTLSGKGTIANLAGGTIDGGGNNGIFSAASGIVKNSGTIASSAGASYSGVYLAAGGQVSNIGSKATIAGGYNGITFRSGRGTVTNQGTIHGGSQDFGISFLAGGLLNNDGAASNIFDNTGVRLINGESTVSNAGTIAGNVYAGIIFGNGFGGTITNTGLITGVNAGIVGDKATGAMITNHGTIQATGRTGIAIDLSKSSNGTIDNFGIIDGAGGTAIAFGSGNNELVVEGGSSIFGTVRGLSSANNTAVFVGSGTLNKGQLVNFQTVDFYNASWTITGSGSLTNVGVGVARGTLTNDGVIGGQVSVGIHGTVDNSGIIVNRKGVGAALTAGGVLNNAKGGSVTGTIGMAINNGRADNAGTITGTKGAGVQLGNGTLTNQKGGLIKGATYGVQITGPGTLINKGTIEDNPTPHAAGVSLGDNAKLVNAAGGTISGTTGVAFTGSGASLSNAGVITGSAGAGVTMNGTGANTVTNSGAIGGTDAGILVTGGTAIITNSGTIAALGTAGIGIAFTGGTGTIDNRGTIDGASGTAIAFAGGNNALILESGSVLKGIADGSNGTNTLVVKGSALLDKAQVTGFTVVAFDDASKAISAGSTVDNASVVGGRLINNGTLTGSVSTGVATTLINHGLIDHTTLSNSGLLTNTGTIDGTHGQFSNFGSVVNHGLVIDIGTLANSGRFANDGTITGGEIDTSGTLINTGYIAGNVINDGSVNNSGTITGETDGLTGGGTIVNSCTIAGTTGTGVLMTSPGSLTNLKGGLIQGGKYGLQAAAGDTVTNAGIIEDDGAAGASLGTGAVLTNQTGGLISGVTGLVFTGAGASVENSGTITGTGGTAVRFDSGANTLTLDTGSVLNGSIDGGGGAGQIQLQGTGTLTNTIDRFGAGSALTVVSGAVWTASGAWGIAAVRNSGTLQPGTAGNPLTLTGDFTQTSGGVLRIVFTGVGQGSKLIVTGTATLDGTVNIVATGAYLAADQRYAIVTATGGVSGTFDDVTVGSGLLKPILVYDAHDAYLTLVQQSVASVAATTNQRNLAGAIDHAAPSSPAISQVIGILDQMSADKIRTTLDRLTGEVYTGVTTTAFQAGNAFAGQIAQQELLARMGDPASPQAMAAGGSGNRFQLGAASGDPIAAAMDHPWGLWMSGYGQTGQFGGDGNTHDLNETYSGGALGLDYQFLDTLRVGLAFGYGQTVFNLDNGNGRGKVDRQQVALYAGYTAGPAYVDGTLALGFGDGTVTRDLSLPKLPANARHDVGDNQYLAAIEAGYSLNLPGTGTLTPFAGVTIDNVDQDGVLPNGNALDISVQSRSASSVRSLIGGRFADTIQIGDVAVAADLKLGWAHEFSRTARTALVALGGNSADSFQVYGAGLPGDSATIGFGLAAAISPASNIYLHYDGDIAGSSATHTITAGFRLAW
ncbi:MAG TPA: hypothetical protein VL899_06575 [Alphaproteobacteria bacterium]|nr:hypothetical protein [Alphaproteobacteria bacterium]